MGRDPSYTITPLQKAIKAAGLTTKLVAERLGIKYSTFQYRVRHGVLSLDDYHRLLAMFGDRPFEELFPNPYKPIAQRISDSVTIPRQVTKKPSPAPMPLPAVAVPIPPTPISVPPPAVTPIPAPASKKREEPFSPSPAFRPMIFSNGALPGIEDLPLE